LIYDRHNAQRGLVFEPRRRTEQSRDLFRAEHQWQLARLTNKVRVLDDGVSLERHPEKEPQRRHGVIDRRRIHPILGKMQLKAPDILKARRVG